MDITEQNAKVFFSERIGGSRFGTVTEVYKFEKIKRAKAEALAKFPSRVLIDMGVGEPDRMAETSLLKILTDEAQKYDNRGYADNGCAEFKAAAAEFMKSQYGVMLDPAKEVMHSIGSKAALSILPTCFVDPGEVVLMTSPGYPIFGTHTKYLMGEVVNVPLLKKNQYLPDLKDIPLNILRRTKAFVVNYPNNPTGATATREFFKELIELAHRYTFVIINDAAYAELTYDPRDRLSLLQVDGAKDVGLELHSMSKAFNMTGWRIGWVCGGERLVAAYATVKDHTDSGQFLAIQKAAAHALQFNDFIPRNNADHYLDRMNKIVPFLKEKGFDIDIPKAGFFVYALAPRSVDWSGGHVDFPTAEAFAQWLIKEKGMVVVPWDETEHAVRFSMTFGTGSLLEDDLIELMRSRFSDVTFHFGA